MAPILASLPVPIFFWVVFMTLNEKRTPLSMLSHSSALKRFSQGKPNRRGADDRTQVPHGKLVMQQPSHVHFIQSIQFTRVFAAPIISCISRWQMRRIWRLVSRWKTLICKLVHSGQCFMPQADRSECLKRSLLCLRRTTIVYESKDGR